MADNYTGTYSGIAQGEQVRAQDMTDALNQMEKVQYKEQGSGSLTASSSDSNYPSSKLVGTNLALKENTSNKKDTINDSSTEYPSSRAVYALLPAGIIFPYGGATAPSGWAFCDGRSVSSSKYPKLYAAIGTVWGGNSTNFNLPDLRGATIRGVGTSSVFEKIVGDAKTADNVKVTLAQIDNDAIRDITGSFSYSANGEGGISGAFYNKGNKYSLNDGSGITRERAVVHFGASKVVPTSTENKVKARGVNFIIKLI